MYFCFCASHNRFWICSCSSLKHEILQHQFENVTYQHRQLQVSEHQQFEHVYFLNEQEQYLEQPYIVACEQGNVEQISNVVHPCARLEDGATLLHIAVQQGDAKMCSKLIELGYDLEQADAHGKTPLMVATELNNFAILQTLIPNYEMKSGEDSLLRVACKYGLVKTLKQWKRWHKLQHGKIGACIVMIKELEPELPKLITLSIQQKHIKVVKYLVKGLRASVTQADDVKKWPPLFEAVQVGSIEIATYLIQQVLVQQLLDGEDASKETIVKIVNTRESNTFPLLIAMDNQDMKMVTFLLEHGADVNDMIGGMPPLCHAADINNLEVVKLMIKLGAKVNGKTDKQRTALHMAAALGYAQVVSFLLEQKDIDIESEDAKKATPLHGMLFIG